MASVNYYAALAIAPSTRRTYSTGQRRYLNFCDLQRWPAFPASDLALSAFAAFLTRSVRPGTIRVYMSSVRNIHIELGYGDPMETAFLLQRVLKGIDRCIGLEPCRPRLPITIGVLRKIVDALDANRLLAAADRAMLRAAMLMAFFGFLRCSEFTSPPRAFDARLHATRGAITFNSGPPISMSLHLKRSKTDPFGRGTDIEIGPALRPHCAVAAMLFYLASTNGTKDDPLFVFSNGTPLTRDAFVDEVRKLLIAARHPNINEYSGHSFRIGAATTAAAAGTPEWLVRTMGRWKSDAVLRYIRTDCLTLRSVAARLASVQL